MNLYRKAKPGELTVTATVSVPAGEYIEIDGIGVRKVLTVNTEAGKHVLTLAALRKDRHRPGYMAEYMRKRRAKK